MGSIIVTIHITLVAQQQQEIECQKCLYIPQKYRFTWVEERVELKNGNVYDYASMISPFISFSFVFKENYSKRIQQQWKLPSKESTPAFTLY